MELTPEQLSIVAKTVYAEAAKEGPTGWAAVAAVIRNRAESGQYPSDPAAVAQAKNRSGTYAFTCWSVKDRKANNLVTKTPPPGIVDAVKGVFAGTIPDPTKGALNYYNPKYSHPSWGPGMTGVINIGNHRFGTAAGGGPRLPPGNIPNPTGRWQGETLKPGKATAPTQAIRDLQGQLTKLGYYHGPIDGTMRPGRATEQALRAAQTALGLKADGRAGLQTFTKLQAANPTLPSGPGRAPSGPPLSGPPVSAGTNVLPGTPLGPGTDRFAGASPPSMAPSGVLGADRIGDLRGDKYTWAQKTGSLQPIFGGIPVNTETLRLSSNVEDKRGENPAEPLNPNLSDLATSQKPYYEYPGEYRDRVLASPPQKIGEPSIPPPAMGLPGASISAGAPPAGSNATVPGWDMSQPALPMPNKEASDDYLREVPGAQFASQKGILASMAADGMAANSPGVATPGYGTFAPTMPNIMSATDPMSAMRADAPYDPLGSMRPPSGPQGMPPASGMGVPPPMAGIGKPTGVPMGMAPPMAGVGRPQGVPMGVPPPMAGIGQQPRAADGRFLPSMTPADVQAMQAMKSRDFGLQGLQEDRATSAALNPYTPPSGDITGANSLQFGGAAPAPVSAPPSYNPLSSIQPPASNPATAPLGGLATQEEWDRIRAEANPPATFDQRFGEPVDPNAGGAPSTTGVMTNGAGPAAGGFISPAERFTFDVGYGGPLTPAPTPVAPVAASAAPFSPAPSTAPDFSGGSSTDQLLGGGYNDQLAPGGFSGGLPAAAPGDLSITAQPAAAAAPLSGGNMYGLPANPVPTTPIPSVAGSPVPGAPVPGAPPPIVQPPPAPVMTTTAPETLGKPAPLTPAPTPAPPTVSRPPAKSTSSPFASPAQAKSFLSNVGHMFSGGAPFGFGGVAGNRTGAMPAGGFGGVVPTPSGGFSSNSPFGSGLTMSRIGGISSSGFPATGSQMAYDLSNPNNTTYKPSNY